ncbi:MAG: undecaprenyldiphospho-muramoylpentapeptide beta-N-acetylglucosaminyltransferase [Anaerolineae bacterium]|nr:undecaprenyldiphospho-muramoylpentapeptide beta-N-acetylglucosaminyltransferase [Anaerolineae bacterium]MDW7990678.1 undecaprenyldiphospho-muramoylpentapeptide beta-N-acetylglucosaminyltransferase [Anaerolineae bacterium]
MVSGQETMFLWMAGGGTGGHVYPGLAVLQALRAKGPVDVLYVGGRGSVEEQLAARSGLPFAGIPAGGVHGLAPWRAAVNLIKLARGFLTVLQLGRRRRPDALFVTGGYASVPVALAAWALRVPILLYLPDIEPGLAVRFIARLATRIGVTVEDSRAFLPAHKVVETGYPVRPEFAGINRTAARAALELPEGERVLLVFGGSTGARSINQAVVENLDALLEMAHVVHISGERDWPWVAAQRDTLPASARSRYYLYPYLHGVAMGQALAAADLAVCRAGASTLGELPYFGLPAVLVPYPYAWRYQRVNAEWLASRGAAVVLEDARLKEELVPTVRSLLGDPARLAGMRERVLALARPNAAKRLAEILCSFQRSAGKGAV